jgi:hypothetical protein
MPKRITYILKNPLCRLSGSAPGSILLHGLGEEAKAVVATPLPLTPLNPACSTRQ